MDLKVNGGFEGKGASWKGQLVSRSLSGWELSLGGLDRLVVKPGMELDHLTFVE